MGEPSVTDYAELEKRLREAALDDAGVGWRAANDATDFALRGALAEEAADAIAALTREQEEAKDLLRKILECDYDAIETARGDLRYGIVDCCDNTGKHYPSQFLADALKAARVLVGDERRLSTAEVAANNDPGEQ